MSRVFSHRVDFVLFQSTNCHFSFGFGQLLCRCWKIQEDESENYCYSACSNAFNNLQSCQLRP